MPSSEYKRIDFRFRHSTILALGLLMGFSFFACSRSAWIKPDGHEVSPTEQLDCAQHAQENSRGEVLEQLEQCMLNKGIVNLIKNRLIFYLGPVT